MIFAKNRQGPVRDYEITGYASNSKKDNKGYATTTADLRKRQRRFLSLTGQGQSLLEYAILLGVVIAALIIMQVYIKRGFQGGLKDAADKIGEQYSPGSTTMKQTREMNDKQDIKEHVATTSTMVDVLSKVHPTEETEVLPVGVYSVADRGTANQTSKTQVYTGNYTDEKTRWNEYSNTTGASYKIGDGYKEPK